MFIRLAVTNLSPNVSYTGYSDEPFIVNFEHTGKFGAIYWNCPEAC
jgi:hypothetical protein